MATTDKYGLTYDVIIIGSGVAGALVAYRLAQAKARVLILEAGGMPSELPSQLHMQHPPVKAERGLLVKNYAASSSKGQDAPYTDEVRNSRYYSSPPAVTAPQPQDEPIGNDPPYYTYEPQDPGPNHKFKSFYERVVGGSTWHWQGLAPRLVPNDMKMKSAFFTDEEQAKKYPGVRDWPIKFSDLAPYYRQAEYEMGVAGNVATDLQLDKYFGIVGTDAARGYPPGFQDGIAMTYLDQYIKRKLTDFHYKEVSPDNKTSIEIPLWVTQVAQAKNAKPFDNRPACDGRGTCVPLCPSRAKYEALFHVEKAVKEGAELQANAVVTKLGFGPSGEVTNVVYKDWTDRERSVQGRIVVLAANAIETPRILLSSEGDSANKVIGKYLMDHPGTGSYGLVPDPVFPFRGPSTTSQIDTTREGPFRKWRAGFRTSLLNYGWQPGVLRGGAFAAPPHLDHGDEKPEDRGGNVLDLVHNNHMIGSALRDKLRHHAHRQIFLGTALEQVPHEANSVSLSKDKKDRFGIPLPFITYSYDDPHGYTGEGLKVAKKVHEAIFKRLGATAYRLFGLSDQGVLTDAAGFFGAGHIMGTTRMGKDGEDRAVDANCLSVNHNNLYIVGSSVFVTGAVANPTLTIAAISLRAADEIKTRLARG